MLKTPRIENVEQSLFGLDDVDRKFKWNQFSFFWSFISKTFNSYYSFL